MDKVTLQLLEQEGKARLHNQQEVKRIQYSIEKVVQKLLCSVANKDPRLTGRLLKVGSYYSGLKINLPDEFDFLFELQTFTENDDFIVRPSGFNGTRNLWRTPEGNPCLKKIEIMNSSLQRFMDKNNDDESTKWLHNVPCSRSGDSEYILEPVGVKNTFFFAISDALKQLDISDFPKYLEIDKNESETYMYGPSITLFFVWNGRHFKNLKISVDLTVCIKAILWEEHFDFGHLLPQNNKIAEHFVQLLHTHGYHLVPYISDRGHKQWKVSTSFLETEFFSKFRFESNLKTVVRIIKIYRDKFVKYRPNPNDMEDRLFAGFVQFYNFYSGNDYDEKYKALLSSYLIKNAVLFAISYTSNWEKVPLSYLYLYILSILYFMIKENEARNFFISDLKLNVPAFGDILPGFHDIFNEIDVTSIGDLPEVPYSTLLFGGNITDAYCVLDIGRLRQIVTLTKHEIEMNYKFWWKSGDAHKFPGLK